MPAKTDCLPSSSVTKNDASTTSNVNAPKSRPALRKASTAQHSRPKVCACEGVQTPVAPPLRRAKNSPPRGTWAKPPRPVRRVTTGASKTVFVAPCST